MKKNWKLKSILGLTLLMPQLSFANSCHKSIKTDISISRMYHAVGIMLPVVGTVLIELILDESKQTYKALKKASKYPFKEGNIPKSIIKFHTRISQIYPLANVPLDEFVEAIHAVDKYGTSDTGFKFCKHSRDSIIRNMYNERGVLSPILQDLVELEQQNRKI